MAIQIEYRVVKEGDLSAFIAEIENFEDRKEAASYAKKNRLCVQVVAAEIDDDSQYYTGYFGYGKTKNQALKQLNNLLKYV